MVWLIVLAVLILPFVIGSFLCKSLRVPEYGSRVGLILFSLVAAVTIIVVALQPEQPRTYTVQQDDTVTSIAERFDLGIKSITDENNLRSPDDLTIGKVLRIPNPKRLEIKRGIDLSGGVILIYEVDEELTKAASSDGSTGQGGAVDITALVDALARRINPGGVKEVVIRPYGDKQVEIIIPDVDDAEVERIKRQIVKAGFLKFLIMATRDDHAQLTSLAAQQPNVRIVRDGAEELGEWVPIARTLDGQELKVGVDQTNIVRELQPGKVEVLMDYDQFNVEGKHLSRGSISKGFDDTMRPAVNFGMTSRGARLFGGLTSSNLPDLQAGRFYRLGIVMDNELISAPQIRSKISDRGQIMGQFTDEEVTELVNVLRAGGLPAVLKAEPITENRIDPLLGADTINKGKFAIGISLIGVLVFMLVYYRFAGIVACFALMLNLALILALMIIIRGAFTLPGLAGLVLTVGMSVDANVLIFERIREELKRGAALRMAIRNGFGKATTTIVDANITTLITAIVLYAIGTDQLRGFAVTLILGILMSMFTAIIVSRVIFDIAERRRFLSKLTMTQLLDEPKLNLMSVRRVAGVFSVALIIVGLCAVGARQRGLLDIDFLGGTSVQAKLTQGMPYSEVWDRLQGVADDLSLTQVSPENTEPDTVWKIDTSLQDNKKLEELLSEKFKAQDGTSLLVSHSVKFDPPTLVVAPTNPPDDSADDATTEELGAGPSETPDAILVPAESEPDETADAEDGSGGASDDGGEASDEEDASGPKENAGSRNELPGEDVLAFAGDEVLRVAQAPTSIGAAPEEPAAVRAKTRLTFDERVTRATLEESLRGAAEKLGVAEPTFTLTGPEGQADSAAGFRQWNLEAQTTPQGLTEILTEMKSGLEAKPAWLSSSKIGGKVAGDTQNKALAAILLSLVCIVAYLWMRFQRVIFGLSAVLALVHDVLITLGAIGLSLYLSKVLGILLIDEFKISLPIVAAFLTIIGYSLNDTIVVFDRIREVKGKSPEITEEIINTSINQTLSRTVLTSLTTLIVVLILYIFGGQGIHGFAFALLVGVLIGTYSSVFVASPALLWMSNMQGPRKKSRRVSKQSAAASS